MDLNRNDFALSYARTLKPDIVSEPIEKGSYSLIGILQDFPDRVLKWSLLTRFAQENFDCEKRAIEILGENPYTVRYFGELKEGLLQFEYHPLRSIRYQYNQGNMPPLAQRFKWCHQAVLGIEYIHSKDLAHHDISTRNILLSSNLDLKFCDFGRATLVGAPAETTGDCQYTFEHLWNNCWERSFQFDLFSLWSLFYEIILGKPPYEARGTERRRSL